MVNIISYIEKYGNKTFDKKSIGEIDYAILTVLSYLNFDDILYTNKTKVKLNDALKEFFSKYTKKELSKHGTGMKDAYEVARAIIDTDRFKDLDVYNYYYVTNHDLQFSAMFIDIGNNEIFISIEGTDDEIAGWKEDFQLSYEFPVPAQKECLNYLKKNISIFDKKNYILSGHSKGGNLALVGAMYLPLVKRSKIKAIYSFDGPGLRSEEASSYRYFAVLDRYHLIISNYSVVGLLLNPTDTYKIVASYKKNMYAHSIYNWKVSDDKFYEVDELSSFSKNIDSTITRWLDQYDEKTRERFVIDLFNIFDRCHIENLYKIHAKNIKEISTFIKESRKLSEESKSMFKELISIFVDVFKEDKFTFRKSKQE